MGKVGYHFIHKRRHIVEVNIDLCFPDLSAKEKIQFAKEIFKQNAIGFFEIAWGWWAKSEDIAHRYTVEGLEHLDAAKADGSGVLLVGAHFVHLDLCGRMINQVTPLGPIYRKHNNPVFEYVITSGRKRRFKNVLERSDMRAIVRTLRQGDVLWYAPDQDYGRNQAVFAPFFGVSAATLVSTSKLARLGRAKTLGLFHYRDPITHQYRIVFEPIDPAFPTGDDIQDATLINALIEKGISVQPDQYMWVHRRFKTRPAGEASFY